MLNSATGLDDLEFMAQLGEALRRLAQVKPGEPIPPRFPDLPTAVQVQGNYTVTGDRVNLNMNLIEKGKAPVLLKVEGDKQTVIDKALQALLDWARRATKQRAKGFAPSLFSQRQI